MSFTIINFCVNNICHTFDTHGPIHVTQMAAIIGTPRTTYIGMDTNAIVKGVI